MNKKLTLALLSAGLLSACAVGPDYQRPGLELPQSWPAAKGAGQTQNAPNWWGIYHDGVLDQIEDEALAHNADIKLAVSRINMARAQLGMSDADRYPVLTANAGANRTEGSLAHPPVISHIQNDYKATLNASYELDLWGKLRRSNEAAQAQLLAAQASQDTVRLSLSTQVAQQYFALLAYDQQEASLQRILQGRQELLDRNVRRMEIGVISGYDLHQAEAEEATLRAQLAVTVLARDKQEAALALLLGRSPRDVMSARMKPGAPALPGFIGIPEGLSTEQLLRRPDLREAEQNLIALNANIGAVRAQIFPSVTLTSYLGRESTAFSDLFSGPAGIFQFAASISQPLFNAGRAEQAVKVAEASRDQALIRYQQAVASAFADVRNALSAQEAARQTLDAANARSAAMAQARDQAEARIKIGLSSRLDLLDAERNYQQAELNRQDAERAQRSAVADFFKAMGGGT
ncbi:MAG: efflux transporter outer membrane subunit [Nitrosomonadales bacterium]|nr:efflux transporter outer membrane subunit [Nitrosomonadales bacterium]